MWLFWLSFFFAISIFSSSKACFLIRPSLPIVCFAPVMLTIPESKSMSLMVSHVNSLGLVPRSLIIANFVAISIRVCWIMKFISSSFGALRFLLYLV